MKTRTFLTTGLIAALLMVATPIGAQEVPESTSAERFEIILSNYESIPTKAQLDQAIPDAQARFIEAASDTKRALFTRQRAISLLSFFPDAVSLDALRALSMNDDAEIRRMAFYTLARTFGKVADDATVAHLARGLEDTSPNVREFTVRGLRYVESEAAQRLLENIAKGDSKEASLARRALEKRAAKAN